MDSWKKFCVEKMVETESDVLKMIEEFRLDEALQQIPIQTWHFSFTEDARNYIVYNIVDTIFGFARHGDQLKDVLVDDRFKRFVRFVVQEEHYCFVTCDGAKVYFHSLTSRMLRLSALVDRHEEDEVEVLLDNVPPCDPVDSLFNHHGSGPVSLGDMNDTLSLIETRVQRAEKDNDCSMPKLSAIQSLREWHEVLNTYEKRLEKLAEAVKTILEQCLQPNEWKGQIVTLFGRHIYFIPQPEEKKIVEDFLCFQENQKLGPSKDLSDVKACLEFPSIVPIIKDATSLPESVLNYIEEKCKLLGKDDSSLSSMTPAEAAEQKTDASTESQPEVSDSRADKTTIEGSESGGQKSDAVENDQGKKADGNDTAKPKENGTAKSAQVTTPVENGTKSTEAVENGTKSTEAVESGTKHLHIGAGPENGDEKSKTQEQTSDPGSPSATKELRSESPIEFSVKTRGKLFHYACPLLGYLPLLPVLDLRGCSREFNS